MRKYFTVEVKPTITASKQHTGAFGAGDILCDWTEFEVPRGANRLIGITAIIRGTDGAAQTARDLEIYFAKTTDSGNTAPPTLGVINATAGGGGFANHIIGSAKLDNTAGADWKLYIDTLSVASTGFGAGATQTSFGVLEGESESGNVSNDKLYLGILTAGALNFSTTVLARGGEAAGVTVVETDKGSDDDPDAELIFSPGDVLHSGTDDVLGTVKSIAAFGSSKQDITFTAATTDAIADNEEIYNVNPIRLILSFER